MGANAQTTVPTFTAAQVLTADQMNQSARTGVPVFADTTARDAGFGGSGEKTLAEGQLCYVENLTGVAQIQYYDGSNWLSLISPALILVGQSSFSAVSTVSLDNVFTSTYQNYRVILALDQPASGNQTVTMRLRVGGADNTNATYVRMLQSSTGAGATEIVSGTSTSFIIGYNGNTSRLNSSFDVFRPQNAEYTSIGGVTISNSSAFNGISRFDLGGWFEAATVFDGLSILMGANTVGTLRVYGYANS